MCLWPLVPDLCYLNCAPCVVSTRFGIVLLHCRAGLFIGGLFIAELDCSSDLDLFPLHSLTNWMFILVCTACRTRSGDVVRLVELLDEAVQRYV